MLVLMTGLPGTGKSTVAAALAREIGGAVLSSDKFRAERSGRARFTSRAKGGVYERLFDRARLHLKGGESVILDATFYLERLRRDGAAVGRRAGVPVFTVEVVAPVPIVKRRMERRLLTARGPRPAGFEVHGFIRRSFEPVRGRHFTVDTSDPKAWRRGLVPIANAMRVVENARRIIAPLRRSRPYRLLQTHISWVLLDGVHAFKIKKPVRFSFVDYSTPRRRLAYCRREIAANSRLSPDLYLGIVPVRDDRGTVSFGGPGRTVDHAVEMREWPQEARLDRLVAAGAVGPPEIERIVAELCAFHARTPAAPPRFGSTRAIRDGFAHAFGLRPLVEREMGAGAALDHIRKKVDGFLRAQAALFRERVRRGRIRRCHGDLRMSNIFLDAGGVHIFDAIEFNPELASTDVAADVAFLAMDLLACGERGLSGLFLASYVRCSGDEGLEQVADLYLCYRALVRLLVEALAIEDPTMGASRKRRARKAARLYLGLAGEFAGRLSGEAGAGPIRR